MTKNYKIHYALRIAAVMCFIGHGAFGIITKQIWCNYFAVFGIGKVMAYRLMPLLGTIDILLGISLLFKPTRIVALWLVMWGLITALCRPLSGEPFAEFLERTGNYGAPFCLLSLSGGFKINRSSLFSTIQPSPDIDEKTIERVQTTLRVVVFLLLIGHGWLNLIQKPGLIKQYSSLGFSNPVNVAITAGIFEVMAGIAVLVRPVRPLLLGFLVWKMFSEMFYPHFEVFEWIERGGSYGSILALWFLLEKSKYVSKKTTVRNGFTPNISGGIS
jgi:hypothetical protein